MDKTLFSDGAIPLDYTRSTTMTWMYTTLVVLLFVLQCVCGTTFITAVPRHQNSEALPFLFISLNGPSEGKVRVATPALTSVPIAERTLSTNNPTTVIRLNSSLSLQCSNIAPRTILIQSDADIVVLAASIISDEQASLGAFSLIPMDQLSTRYMTVASCTENVCFIMVINGGVEKVNVNVTFSKQIKEPISFNDISYYGSDVIECTLEAYHALQIRAIQQNLTGTVVEADSPVAVLSGGAYTTLRYPMDRDRRIEYDHIVEQMPPVTSLGRSYILIPFPDHDHPTVVKVVFTVYGTSLTYDTSVLTMLYSSSEYMAFLLKDAGTVLEASHPVMVALFSQSGLIGQVDNFAASAVILSAISTYSSAYLILVPTFDNDTVYVSVAINSSCDSEFYLNKRRLLDLEWLQTENQTYNTTTFMLGSEDRYVLENPGCVFGGYAFSKGQDEMAAYGFFEHVPEMLDFSRAMETTVTIVPTASDYRFTGPTLTDMTEVTSDYLFTGPTLTDMTEVTSDYLFTGPTLTDMTEVASDYRFTGRTLTDMTEVKGHQTDPVVLTASHVTSVTDGIMSSVTEITALVSTFENTKSAEVYATSTATYSNVNSYIDNAADLSFGDITLVSDMPTPAVITSLNWGIYDSENTALHSSSSEDGEFVIFLSVTPTFQTIDMAITHSLPEKRSAFQPVASVDTITNTGITVSATSPLVMVSEYPDATTPYRPPTSPHTELHQASSTPPSLLSPNHIPSKCACACPFQQLMRKVARGEYDVEEAKENTTNGLLMERSNLSATRRKVTSAENFKKSSTYSGGVVLGVFCGLLLIVIILHAARYRQKRATSVETDERRTRRFK